MSVQSQIDRIEQNVANTYAVLEALGADMPAEQNSDNLATTAGSTKAVLYSAQTLTEAQKAQARENIGVDDSYKAELVTAVMEAIGCPVYGVIDENNYISLSGPNVPDGEYHVRFIFEDGSTTTIGDMVKDTNVYYSVTNTLTNCTTNNSATKAVQGGSYSATITANSGYTLKSVSATMGGQAVAVSGGTINIANVTGNIVITAVAEVSGPAYTNQIPISTDANGNLFVGTNGEKGYKTGFRLSLSGGGESAQEGTECTGFIPATKNSVLYIKNIAYLDDTARGVVAYDANFAKTPTGTNGINLNSLFNTYGSDEGNGVRKSARLGSLANFSDGDSIRYIRLCSTDINENSILTVDEPIV